MLNKKQIDLIGNILTFPTTGEAIKQTKISSRTAYKWMNENEEFRFELAKRKSEALSSVTGYLQASLAVCSEKLMEIINDEEVRAQIKLNAISIVFQNTRALTEQTDILERLIRLENSQEGTEE